MLSLDNVRFFFPAVFFSLSSVLVDLLFKLWMLTIVCRMGAYLKWRGPGMPAQLTLGSKPNCISASTISVLELLSVGEWIAGHARDSNNDIGRRPQGCSYPDPVPVLLKS